MSDPDFLDGFDAQPSHLPQTPAGRAAGLARACMIFRQQLKHGLLQPEGTKEAPLCMDTYRSVNPLIYIVSLLTKL
jgi:carnitine O-acetyltransferase